MVALGLVGLGVALSQLAVHGFLSYYDTGVYLASALHFVSGTLPYSRFTFVEPPGIVLLLSPVAALSHVVGVKGSLAIARVVSAVVFSANVSLLAWLVRHRGRTAMFVSGLSLACIPVAAYVATGVKLESYCVLFSLCSAVVAFGAADPDRSLTPRRAVVAGALMGGALLIKFFAVAPFAVAAVVIARRSRRRAADFAAGAAATFAVVCAPFFIAAPRAFVSQVFVDQLIRRGTASDQVSTLLRLKMLTGFAFSEFQPSVAVALAVLGVALALMVGATLRRRQTTPGDDFLTITAVVLALALLIPSHSAVYYYYVTAPFLIGAVVSSTLRLIPPGAWGRVQARLSRGSRVVVTAAGAVMVVGLALGASLWATTIDASQSRVFGYPTAQPALLDNVIPAGACVVYSQIFDGLSAGRFVANGDACPPLVDTFGMWLAWGNDRSRPPKGLVHVWRSSLARADYAVLSSGGSSNVPWTADLRSWFDAHFRLVKVDPYFTIYKNVGT